MTMFRGFIDAEGNPVATILLPDGEHQIYGPETQRVPVTLGELRQQLGRVYQVDSVRIDAEGTFRIAQTDTPNTRKTGKRVGPRNRPFVDSPPNLENLCGSRLRCGHSRGNSAVVSGAATSARRPSETSPRSQPMATKKRPSKSPKTQRVTQPSKNSRHVESKRGTGKASQPVAAKAENKKLSALDAAALVLAESTEPLNCQEMIAAMARKGLWTSPGGKTPAATLYSAILKEIRTKGIESRFQKTARGKFART